MVVEGNFIYCSLNEMMFLSHSLSPPLSNLQTEGGLQVLPHPLSVHLGTKYFPLYDLDLKRRLVCPVCCSAMEPAGTHPGESSYMC